MLLASQYQVPDKLSCFCTKYVQGIFIFQRVSSWSKGDKDKKDKEDERKDWQYNNNNNAFLERRMTLWGRQTHNLIMKLLTKHDSMRGSSPNVMRVFLKHFLCSCRQKYLIFIH